MRTWRPAKWLLERSSDGLATIHRGLELFPEDAALRSAAQQTSADGITQQGIAQFKQGNMQAAMGQFRAAVQANPNDAVAHDYIGVILAESGRLNEAIAEFDQATRLDPAFARSPLPSRAGLRTDWADQRCDRRISRSAASQSSDGGSAIQPERSLRQNWATSMGRSACCAK